MSAQRFTWSCNVLAALNPSPTSASMVAFVDASRIVFSRCACTVASRAAVAWASFLSAFFASASASKSCVTSVTKNSWSSVLTCPASPSAIWPICRSSSWTRWSIFGLFSQSFSDVSDVIGLGCCGEGDGLGCGSGRRFASGWRLSRSVSLGTNGTAGLDSRLAAGGGLDGSSAEGAATFAKHFSFLCRLGSTQTKHAPHLFGRPRFIRREAALPPARSGGQHKPLSFFFIKRPMPFPRTRGGGGPARPIPSRTPRAGWAAYLWCGFCALPTPRGPRPHPAAGTRLPAVAGMDRPARLPAQKLHASAAWTICIVFAPFPLVRAPSATSSPNLVARWVSRR